MEASDAAVSRYYFSMEPGDLGVLSLEETSSVYLPALSGDHSYISRER